MEIKDNNVKVKKTIENDFLIDYFDKIKSNLKKEIVSIIMTIMFIIS